MTEWVWERCADPRLMAEHAAAVGVGGRKWRLFAAALARLDGGPRPAVAVQAAVAAAERVADGLDLADVLEGWRAEFGRAGWSVGRAAVPADRPDESSRTAWVAVLAGHRLSSHFCYGGWWDSVPDLRKLAARLLRDVVGNPFRPAAWDPAWITPTAAALASGIYDERAFDRLPVLADALEDAGCEDADILGHLRGDGPHVRGCWPLDLVLGKS